MSRSPIIRFALAAARNFEPSSATSRVANNPCSRQNNTNARHVPTIPGPFSRRKSAIVLKSGASRRSSHMSSTLRKLYVYGYLNEVRSSRKLERECGRIVRYPAGRDPRGLLGDVLLDH